MNDQDKLKLNLDDKVFIRLDDDDDNDNDNDNDEVANTEVDLLTSFQNSFKSLQTEPIIHIDDDDDNENTNIATSSNIKREINLNSNPNPGPLAQLFKCDMCTNTKPKYKSMLIKGCTHFFCCECIETHVSSKLRDGATDISCPVPDCMGTLDPEYCKDFISKEIYNRWGEQLCEWAILDGQKYYCPFVDCSIMLVKDCVEEVTMAECPYCHRMFCAVCRVVWHHGVTCEEHQKKTLVGGC